MKKIILAVTGMMLCQFLAAQNLVENPGFESFLSGWTFATGTISEHKVVADTNGVTPYEGSKFLCVNITGDRAGNDFKSALVKDPVNNLKPNQNYILSFRVYVTSPNPEENVAVRLRNPKPGTWEFFVPDMRVPVTTGSWQKVEVGFSTTSVETDMSDVFFKIGLSCSDNPPYEFYLDDFELLEILPPQVLNDPDFEIDDNSWTVSEGGISTIDIIPEVNNVPVPSGDQYMKISLSGSNSDPWTSGISQTLSGLESGKIYEVSMDALSMGDNYYDSLFIQVINPEGTDNEVLLAKEKRELKTGHWTSVNTRFKITGTSNDLSDAIVNIGFADNITGDSPVDFYIDNISFREVSVDLMDLRRYKTIYDLGMHFAGKMKYASSDPEAHLRHLQGAPLFLTAQPGSSMGRASQLSSKLLPGIKYTFRVTYWTNTLNQETEGPDKILFNNKVVWERPAGFTMDDSKNSDSFNFTYVSDSQERPWVWFWFSSMESNNKWYTNGDVQLEVACTSAEVANSTPVYTYQELPEYIWQPEVKLPFDYEGDWGLLNHPVDPVTDPKGYIATKPVISTELLENRFNPDAYLYLTERNISGISVSSYRTSDNYLFINPDTNPDPAPGDLSSPSDNFSSLLENLSAAGKLKMMTVKSNTFHRQDIYDGDNQIKIVHYLSDHAGNTELSYWLPEVPNMLDYKKNYAIPGNHDYPDPGLYEYLDLWSDNLKSWNNDVVRSDWGPEDINIIQNTHKATFPLAWCYRSDINSFMVKTIERQNVQLVMANARGHALATGTPCVMRLDAWAHRQKTTWWPEEMVTVFRDFYYGGADYIDHESGEAIQVLSSGIYPTTKGVALLDFSEFVSKHHGRGELNTPFGIMYGRGNIMGSIHIDGTALFYPEGTDLRMRYDKDMNYMDVFFPDFGTATGTNEKQLFTGTPYGTVDLIPFDGDTEDFNRYRMIMMVGLNGMKETQARNLRAFVENGGTLVMALGHAMGDEKYGERTFRGATLFKGLNLGLRQGEKADKTEQTDISVKYDVNTGGATAILATWSDGTPKIVEYEVGEGKIILTLTEALNHVDNQDDFRPLLDSLAAEHAAVTTLPYSPWLETFLMKHDTARFSLAVFNHGHLDGVPESMSGNTEGDWNGEVLIDIEKSGIDTSGLKVFITYPEQLRGNQPGFMVDSGKLAINLNVDHFCEIMLTNKSLTDIEGIFNTAVHENFRIRLTAEDIETGEPVPDCILEFRDTILLTGVNGSAVVENADYGSYTLQAEAPGYKNGSYTGFIFSDTTIIYRMKANLADLSLEITDSHTGEPVPDCYLEIGGRTFRTNAQGIAFVDSIEYGTYTLSASADNYFNGIFENIGIVSDSSLVFSLEKDYPDLVLGVVDRNSGISVSQAIVNFYGEMQTSNTSGEVVIQDIMQDKWAFSIEHPEYFTHYDTLSLTKDSTVTAGLTPLLADVQFTIRDAEGPAENIPVIMNNFTITTDQNGLAYFFDQPARTDYPFSINESGYKTVQNSFYLELDTVINIILEKTTGIGNYSSAGLKIYPNPAKNSGITIELEEQGNAVAEIFEISGVKVFEKPIFNQKLIVPEGTLPPGIYLIKVTGKKNHKSEIIIIEYKDN